MSNGNSLFSSLSSFFGGGGGGASSSSSSSSPGGYQVRQKGSVFGSGLPSAARRGPPSRLDTDDDSHAWSLPYSSRSNGGAQPGSANGVPQSPYGMDSPMTPQYPPAPRQWGSASTTQLARRSTDDGGMLHHNSSSANVSIPSTAYPPLRHTWTRIRAWCDTHYEELADTLNWPATNAALDDVELTIGFALPPAVRDSYLCYDGQELESKQSCSDGLFFGLPLLPLERVVDEWKFWRAVDDDESSGANGEVKGWMTSCPAGWVRAEYSCRGWLPLITDHVGNYVGVDLSPAPGGGGAPGQVILFGRDFDTKVVLWRGEGEGGWGRFLQYIAEELENGEMWSLDDTSAGSDEEEDGLGYESYFTEGGSGTGKGGGDRIGSGAAGFRLTGDYRGWPVLEAWADRSMRCWEEVGLTPGQPAWMQETPSVRLQGAVDENGEALDAEGSGSSAVNGTASSDATVVLVDDDAASHGHPLAQGSQDSDTARRTDTLSPPVASTKASRSKQKQREVVSGTSSAASSATLTPQRPRRPPPAPAQSLDLPTIEDVRAAHAAALAMESSAGKYHYDMGRNRPPPGSGGSGMGMGMLSGGGGLLPSSRHHGGGGHAGEWAYRDSTGARGDDGVELDTRTSSDILNPAGTSHATLSDVIVDGAHGRSSTSLASPRASFSSVGSRPSPLPGGNSRTLLGSNGEMPSLIDAGSVPSSPNLRGSTTQLLAHHEAHVSSPLAGTSSTFEAYQGAGATKAPPPAMKSPPHSRTNSIMGSAALAMDPNGVATSS